MRVKNRITMLVGILFLSCNNKLPLIHFQKQITQKTTSLSKKDFKNWHFKDIVEDTIPGISLTKAYREILKDKRGKEVIVAVIDTEIDIHHESLKDAIWINTKEIPNNRIDDDNNGYVDDIVGWNFLGKNTKYVNYEYTRILRKYNPIFKNKEIGDIALKDTSTFHIYKRCQIRYDTSMKDAITKKKNYDLLYRNYYQAKMNLVSHFPHEKYTIKKLDSLKKTTKDTVLTKDILLMTELMEYNVTESYVINSKEEADNRINKLLRLTYNDRLDLGDNPEDIADIGYGNNKVNNKVDFLDHGTKIAGIIASKRNAGVGSNGIIANNVKIMSLAVAAFGDEHDKDIALAIKYAVDNGAKVINMSFGKEFSLHPEWVYDAIKYADKNDVIIISSAGNFSNNLNISNDYYPNDNVHNGEEISNNFLLVGSISNNLNKKFLSGFSNYGSNDVDIFAQGKKIRTTLPNNKYTNSFGGTSAASAIASGVAALIFSYYPNLKAHQVKKIIMDSGVEYAIEVSTPTKEDKNKTTPFNQLSKSGKVVNAYNALIMAERIASKN